MRQLRDGIALGSATLQARNPNLMVSALKSMMSVLSRISLRAFHGPCENRALPLTVPLLEAVAVLSKLQEVRMNAL